MNSEYLRFVRDLKIVDKSGDLVEFNPNLIQTKFLSEDYTARCVILKARQQGFSSIINATLTCDFLFRPHTYNVVIADTKDNAEGLLDRVKKLIESWKDKHEIRIDFSTDSKYHLRFGEMDCDYVVATAGSEAAGRSKTITNLHLSEAAYYPNLEEILAGAGQAVIPEGRLIIETTANGYNSFKSFWDNSKLGMTGYKALFYKASSFYLPEYLVKKRMELGNKFSQEYPETDTEAFLSSGNKYFEPEALMDYLQAVESRERILV